MLQPGEIDCLADCRNDQVGFDVLFAAFDIFDLQLAAGDLGFTLHHAQCGGTAIGIAHDADRHQAALDVDAFGQRLLDLVLVGLHLVDVEYRSQCHFRALLGGNIGDILRHASGDGMFGIGRFGVRDMAQTARDGRHVDGSIAAADDYDAFADVLQTSVVERLQERGCGDHVRGFAIGDRQRATSLRTHAEEHRIELLADLLQCDVLADMAVHARLHAQIDDALDFSIQHIARGTKAGDTVAHHAAEEFVLVENGDFVPLQCQLIGAGQAGRAAAEDRNFLAGRFDCRFVEFQLVGNGVFAEEVFHRVDADVVFHFIAVAAGLARSRAHTPHHRRERVGFGQTAPGIFLPGHSRFAVGAIRHFLGAAHNRQIAANVFARRATALAWRGGLDVSRALVGIAGLEYLLVQARRLVVAILVTAERELLRGFDCC